MLLPTLNYRDPPNPRQLRGLCVVRHSASTPPPPPGRLLFCPLLTSFFPPGLPADFRSPCLPSPAPLSPGSPSPASGMAVSVGWVPRCESQPWSGMRGVGGRGLPDCLPFLITVGPLGGAQALGSSGRKGRPSLPPRGCMCGCTCALACV